MIKTSDLKYIVISLIGPHAGESETEIFERKIQDINNVGKTFWLIKSRLARPEMVNELCLKAKTEGDDVYCIFIEASKKGGSNDTKSLSLADSYSMDKITWNNLPLGLSPVTGKIDRGSFALVLNSLELVNDHIDLWKYSDFFNQENPLEIMKGASTICAIRKDKSHHPFRIKSPDRRIIAIGRFYEPFCVFLKTGLK